MTEPVVTVERRYGSDGTWAEWENPTATPGPDGVFELRVRDWLQAQFRVVARSGDGTSVVRSQVFANAREPNHLSLNSSVAIYGLYDEPHGPWRFAPYP